jgi:hypothetical protein
MATTSIIRFHNPFKAKSSIFAFDAFYLALGQIQNEVPDEKSKHKKYVIVSSVCIRIPVIEQIKNEKRNW